MKYNQFFRFLLYDQNIPYYQIKNAKSKNQKLQMLLNNQTQLSKQQSQSGVQKAYIMLREPLKSKFNLRQWEQICTLNAQAFQHIQNKIFNTLIINKELFEKYFALFYENHVKIYHWYLLSRQKHYEIKAYIYKSLLRKSLEDYKLSQQSDLLKIKQLDRQSRQRKDYILTVEDIQNKRYKIDDLTNEIFDFMAHKTKTASLLNWQKIQAGNSLHQVQGHKKSSSQFNKLKQSQLQLQKQKVGQLSNQNKENVNQLRQTFSGQSCADNIPYAQNGKTARNKWRIKTSCIKNKDDMIRNFDNKSIFSHDFHALYLQTFHACDGSRYIFYNYQKHMKGLSQKDKYNMFIRGQNKARPFDIRLTQNSDEQNLISQIKSCQYERKNAAYQYSSFGSAIEDVQKKRTSKVVFRRMRSKNIGKFIRK